MEILRPFMLLACVAFTVGFIGYWALVGLVSPPGDPGLGLQPAQPAVIATPAPEPALAVTKQI